MSNEQCTIVGESVCVGVIRNGRVSPLGDAYLKPRKVRRAVQSPMRGFVVFRLSHFFTRTKAAGDCESGGRYGRVRSIGGVLMEQYKHNN